MGDLWDWTGVDALGRSRDYQTYDPAESTQAYMLEHLRAHYPHLRVTRLDRVTPGQLKPRTGTVESHAFQHGIMDAVRRELGLLPPDRRRSIVEELKREPSSPSSPSPLAGARPPSALDRYRSVRDRLAPVIRKQQQ